MLGGIIIAIISDYFGGGRREENKNKANKGMCFYEDVTLSSSILSRVASCREFGWRICKRGFPRIILLYKNREYTSIRFNLEQIETTEVQYDAQRNHHFSNDPISCF